MLITLTSKLQVILKVLFMNSPFIRLLNIINPADKLGKDIVIFSEFLYNKAN